VPPSRCERFWSDRFRFFEKKIADGRIAVAHQRSCHPDTRNAKKTADARASRGQYELTNPARPKRQILRPARVRRLDIRPSSAGQSLRDQALDAAFFVRAEMQKNASRNQSEADADYEKAAQWAALMAPYRHARRSAMRLPNSRFVSETMGRSRSCSTSRSSHVCAAMVERGAL
jgi:hypothetical protein